MSSQSMIAALSVTPLPAVRLATVLYTAGDTITITIRPTAIIAIITVVRSVRQI